jgi:hypothetical protein
MALASIKAAERRGQVPGERNLWKIERLGVTLASSAGIAKVTLGEHAGLAAISVHPPTADAAIKVLAIAQSIQLSVSALLRWKVFGLPTALAPGDASTVALEALNFQIEKVADELVPFSTGLATVADQDRFPDFIG